MKTNKIIAYTFLVGLLAFAQAGIFELYGLGKIGINYSSAAIARGKTSVAYTDSMNINFQNPAMLAYVNGSGLAMSGASNHNNILGVGNTNNYSGFNYGNIKIPVTDRGGMMLGLIPLTSVNSSYKIENTDDGYTETTEGMGNLYSASLGFGYSFFKRQNLAIGGSFDLIVGGYTLTNTLEFIDSTIIPVAVEHDESYDGTQINLGLSYSPLPWLTAGASLGKVLSTSKRTISTYMANGSNNYYTYTDTTDYTDLGLIFPDRLTAGIAVKLSDKHVITADYLTYNASILDDAYSFNPLYDGLVTGDFQHIGLGFERVGTLSKYVPYAQAMTYRAGLYYDTNYLRSNNILQSIDTPIKTYGFTLGAGIPFTEFANRVDLTFSVEYNTGIVYNTEIIDAIHADELYFRFDIGILISETWFNTKGKLR